MPAPIRRLRMGMVGGGPGAFIGPVHCKAAQLDGQIELVAGAFSHDPRQSKAAGITYGIEENRAYPSYAEMIERERTRPDRIDFLIIVTPNHLHFPVAKLALESGFPVLSDKPATATLEEAIALQDCIRRTNGLYGLTYTYTGYPSMREARERCRRGDLGAIRKVVVEYPQGWLSTRLETTGSKQAGWRTDPAQSGLGGCIGDIGIHAFNTVEFVTGHRVTSLCADVSTVMPNRALDDDCNVLLRLDNGAPGILYASQISVGERNGLRLRVYGERGALDWAQEDPNRLKLNMLDQPDQILHVASNAGYLSEANRTLCRLPLGHPEGFIEALANLYREFAALVRAKQAGQNPPASLVPTMEEGLRSMAFIKIAVDSSRKKAGWVQLPKTSEIS